MTTDEILLKNAETELVWAVVKFIWNIIVVVSWTAALVHFW